SVTEMSQKRRGRPPAAWVGNAAGDGPARLDYFRRFFCKAYDVDPFDPSLTWRVTFLSIIKKVRAVFGNAGIMGLNRRTISRIPIRIDDDTTLARVIDHWRDLGRPIVRHSNPYHRLNCNSLLWIYLDMINSLLAAGGWQRSGKVKITKHPAKR